ncbi:MAG: histidine phosphatase family protein [Melioribacteraceae bacterium]|nr:histidine phosphatase family protein [Melioribacteraceae bacterium]
MKIVFLVRHAKSSWKENNLSDFERPLNNRGRRDAPFMADLFKSKNTLPDLMLSSPANRAITTARIFAELFAIDKNKIITDPSIYEAGAGELLDIINGLENKYENVMLFGHNPSITMISNYLSDKRIENIPTCGIVKIIFKADSWRSVEIGTGILASFEYPKKYFRNN